MKIQEYKDKLCLSFSLCLCLFLFSDINKKKNQWLKTLRCVTFNNTEKRLLWVFRGFSAVM